MAQALNKPIILIPARMASTRLPGKPLAEIAGKPMIAHVLKRAQEADIGPVVVACAEKEIARAIEREGGRAVLTRPSHTSGTDRIMEALNIVDSQRKYNIVINLQGDLPAIKPRAIGDVLLPLETLQTDIATLAAEIRDEAEKNDPNVVKAVISFASGRAIGKALYFTRAAAPYGEGALWHHIGIYAYRREVLERFAALPQSPLEKREKLEQLRALENGMTIGVALSRSVPFGVDTPADLEKARALLSRKG